MAKNFLVMRYEVEGELWVPQLCRKSVRERLEGSPEKLSCEEFNFEWLSHSRVCEPNGSTLRANTARSTVLLPSVDLRDKQEFWTGFVVLMLV